MASPSLFVWMSFVALEYAAVCFNSNAKRRRNLRDGGIMKTNAKTKVLALLAAGMLAVAVCGLAACSSGSTSTSSSAASSSSEATSASSSVEATSSADTATSEQGTYNLVSDGVLTVGTSADFPPFEYLEGNEIVGFDAALIREVGSRLGLDVDLQNQAFDSLVTAVAGGSSLDAAISGITITPDRAQEVDFSNSYYDSNLAIVVLKDAGYEATDANAAKEALADAALGAQSGTSGEDWIKENLGANDYTPQQDVPDLLNQLRTGAIQAAVYDAPVAEAHVNGEYTDCEILCVIPTGEQYGIIVNMDNPDLTDAINAALSDMEMDGTIDKLVADYLA